MTVVELPYSEVSQISKDRHESASMSAEEGKALSSFICYLVVWVAELPGGSESEEHGVTVEAREGVHDSCQEEEEQVPRGRRLPPIRRSLFETTPRVRRVLTRRARRPFVVARNRDSLKFTKGNGLVVQLHMGWRWSQTAAGTEAGSGTPFLSQAAGFSTSWCTCALRSSSAVGYITPLLCPVGSSLQTHVSLPTTSVSCRISVQILERVRGNWPRSSLSVTSEVIGFWPASCSGNCGQRNGQ